MALTDTAIRGAKPDPKPFKMYDREGLFLLVNPVGSKLWRWRYRDRMTGHGFRGLASTILNEHEFDEAHIELQLAHTKRKKVAAAYNHAKYLKQRTEMMQWWADYLDEQLAKGQESGCA